MTSSCNMVTIMQSLHNHFGIDSPLCGETDYVQSETKWPTFFRRHFLEWKCLNFEYNLTEVFFLRVQSTIFQHWFRWWLGAGPGDKPLSEPMMVSLLTYWCVTRPQWVNCHTSRGVPLREIDFWLDSTTCTLINFMAHKWSKLQSPVDTVMDWTMVCIIAFLS